MNEKDKFWAYEKVRRSGITNMFNLKFVSELSGLSRNDILFVMNNYTELNEKYGRGEE